MSQYDMNVHDYFRIIRKRKWVIIFTTLAVYIAAIVYTKMQTKLYESIAIVCIANKAIKNDAIYDISKTQNYNSTAVFQNASDIIHGKNVALRVINQLQLLEKNASINEINSVIGKLIERLEVTPDEKSGQIVIKLNSSEPVKATMIVNAVAEAYRIEAEKQSRYSEQVLVEYLKEQLEIAKLRTDQSYNDLLSFKQTYNLEISSPGLLTPQKIESMENELDQTAKKRIDLEKQIELIQQKRSGRDINISLITALTSDPDLNVLMSDQVKLKTELNELNQKYMPQHPKIYTATEKLNAVNERLEVALDNKINLILSNLELSLNSLYTDETKLKRNIEIYRIKIAKN